MYSESNQNLNPETLSKLEESKTFRRIQDYSKFNPKEYIKEYYANIGEENKFLLEFYHNTYNQVPTESSLLEFGGGPTIYQLISAAQHVKEIIFADYLECNRNEISNWISKHESAANWDPYLDYVLELNYRIISVRNREQLKSNLIERISQIIECDAYQVNVLKNSSRKSFDIVSSGFCLECISSEERDFREFVKKVCRLVKKDGLLVMTLLKNSEYYTINDLSFPTFPVDEDYIQALLKAQGFRDIEIHTCQAEHDQGYEGIIGLTAKA